MTSILVAKGAQDAYFTDNPQVSFFRSSYKRYGNFSQTVLSQVISGSATKGGISDITIDHKGDLLGHVFFTKKNSSGQLQPDITANDIEKVEILIGDQIIDSISTDQLVSERFFSCEKYARTQTSGYEKGGVLGFYGSYMYPLGFWFCSKYSFSLPVIALQYHTVRIRITWGAAPETGGYYEAWSNYIHLDTKEREEMASKPMVVAIPQHQEAPLGTGLSLNLPFNNPVRYIYGRAGTTDIMGKPVPDITEKIWLCVNGVDLTDRKEIHPHYTAVPCLYNTYWGGCNATDTLVDVVPTVSAGGVVTAVDVQKETGARPTFFHPFCLYVNDTSQWNGSCNFSRLDTFELKTTSPIVTPHLWQQSKYSQN